MQREAGTHTVPNKGDRTDFETELAKETQGPDDACAAATGSHRSGTDLENFLSSFMYGE